MADENQSERAFDKKTDRLSEYIVNEEYDDIPEAALERERWHILDTLGCILYGSTTPWVNKLIDSFDDLGESGDASVLGSELSLSAPRAALLNGTGSHSMDFDDHCKDAGIHAGANTVPNALAFAEVSDEPVSGEEFLTAVTVGVETGIRCGLGMGFHASHRGFHIAGFTGPFASVATTGKLYDLSHHEMGHGIGLAATQGSGLIGAQYGAEVKRYHPGRAAESGYLAAAYADHGFTGDTKTFGDRYGSIATVFTDDYDLTGMTEGIGDTYELVDKLSLKMFPSIAQIHHAVTGVVEIVEEEGLTYDDVASVLVEANQHVVEHVGWEYEPADVMSAQGSAQYGVATLLEDGKLTIDSFTEEAIRRPEILERTEDVRFVVDEEIERDNPDWFGSVVTVTTDTGSEFTKRVDHPLGYPENPMSEEQLLEKFRNQAAPVMTEEEIEKTIEFVLHIDEHEDVSELFEYLP